MYNDHFNLQKTPFSLTPNTEFYCELPSHEEALETILFSLKQGDGFVKVTAEVGLGKTLLCRRLLNVLDENFTSCYIPNPDLSPDGFRKALAIELGIDIEQHSDQHTLLGAINKTLLEHYTNQKRVVLIVDEAQALSFQTLETLRLLTNLETESDKLLHIVLFGQPELDHKLQSDVIRQLRQRISFSYTIRPLRPKEINTYIASRLIAAGHANGILFTKQALKKIYKASRGTPRLINVLCHKALLVAYGVGALKVDTRSVIKSISDTASISYKHPFMLKNKMSQFQNGLVIISIIMSCSVTALLFFLWINHTL